MYKLVVIEDEFDVRQRLISLIEKSNSKFEIVAEYENGIDAYDGITQDCPDLIITDIHIPYIEGTELCRRVRELLPLVKIVFITGYNDFDYAKQAANLGVLGFVNKPVTLDDIQTLLKKAEDAIDTERGTAESINRLRSFYENSLPIIRNNDLYRLSNMTDIAEAFERKLKHDGIDLGYQYFAMCVFDFDKSVEEDSEKYDLVFSSLHKLVYETFKGFCEIELFNRYEKLCLMLKSNNQISMQEVEALLERIILLVRNSSGISISVGASDLYQDNKNFAAMTREAMRALTHRAAMGGAKVFLFGNTAPRAYGKIAVDDAEVREIGYTLRHCSAEQFDACINRLKEKFSGAKEQGSYYYLLTGILNALVKSCDNLEGLYGAYDGQDNIYQRLFALKTPDMALAFFSELAEKIRTLNQEVIVDNVEANLAKVISYINVHYNDADLSFELLSKNVNFSVSYISALMKKRMNTTFVKYLTQLRMEQAKSMLLDPSLKIIDVAEKLGYLDPYYFSHCFKKYSGVTPKEYRNNG